MKRCNTQMSPISSEGSTFDDDTDFRWAKQAAVRLLQELERGNEAGIEIPDDTMSAFAGAAYHHRGR